jgi:hypothetical protein
VRFGNLVVVLRAVNAANGDVVHAIAVAPQQVLTSVQNGGASSGSMYLCSRLLP